MRAFAVNGVLVLGLVAGTWCGIWLSRRTDLSHLRDQGTPRLALWLLKGLLFLGPLCLVTLPFELLARMIE